MDSKLITDIVDVGCLEIYLWLAVAFETAICLKQIGLKLISKVYHVRTETIERILFPFHSLLKDLFGLQYNLPK